MASSTQRDNPSTPIPHEGWETRCRTKLTATAVISTIAATHSSMTTQGSILAEVPPKVLGYTASMALFCGLQEGIRVIRGTHDAWNSFFAGAITGSFVAGYYQGPQFRFLGGALWAPICGCLHIANEIIQPRIIFEDFMIDEGLLDPVVRDRRLPSHLRAEEAYRAVRSEHSMNDLLKLAKEVEKHELASLNSEVRGGAFDTAPLSPALQSALDSLPKSSVDCPYEEDDGDDDEVDYQNWLAASGSRDSSEQGEPEKKNVKGKSWLSSFWPSKKPQGKASSSLSES